MTTGIGTRLLGIYACGVLLFVLVPMVVVLPTSFTAGASLSFPPDGFSPRWYEELVDDRRWINATLYSLRLGLVTALISTTIGFMAAYAMQNHLKQRLRGILIGLALLPFIVPTVIGALAVFEFADWLGVRGSFTAMVLAHVILTIPFSVILLNTALERLDRDLILAARSLGATTPYLVRRVMVPILAPSILGSLLFSFIMSWDELIMALLIGDVRNRTLPVLMYEFLSTRIEPTVAAMSSVLILMGLIVILVQEIVGRRSKKARATGGSQP